MFRASESLLLPSNLSVFGRMKTTQAQVQSDTRQVSIQHNILPTLDCLVLKLDTVLSTFLLLLEAPSVILFKSGVFKRHYAVQRINRFFVAEI